MSEAPEPQQKSSGPEAVIVTLGRVVVEAETAAARDDAERKGYIVLEVNCDNSNQAVSF